MLQLEEREMSVILELAPKTRQLVKVEFRPWKALMARERGMKQTRKKHGAAFKAKVTLSAI
jgi:hypothetical protein